MPPQPGYQQGFRRPAIREALSAGPATVVEIAERIGLARRTVDAHLNRMRVDGEVKQELVQSNRPALWSLAYEGTMKTTEAKIARNALVSTRRSTRAEPKPVASAPYVPPKMPPRRPGGDHSHIRSHYGSMSE